jgi:outer membrane lipoprotein-sorting protein
MPFFVVFIGCMQEDFGLGILGYTLARHEKKGSILTSFWRPPKNLVKLLGETILVHDANRLVRVEYRSPKGTLLREGIFNRHTLFGGYYFPLEISISSKSTQESTLEKVTYIDPRFNAALPAAVKDFKLPPGVQVKEVDW